MTAAAHRLPPRAVLATLPTPLVAAPGLADELGTGPLHIKRDDLSGFVFAGTKARKLEFLLAAAQHAGADVLLTGGAPGSNFAPATAAAARRAGLECHLLVAATTPGPTDWWHPNLAAARAWGARLHWTNTERRTSVDDALPRLTGQLTAEGHRPYVLPRGGATGLGAVGGVTAALELHAQLQETGESPRHLIVAVGSGGTLAGLLIGNALLDRPWTITGVSVSRPPDEVASRVRSLADECADIIGAGPADTADIHIIDGRGPGHGCPSYAGEVAARQALRAAGLVLDPVYTAKALAALPGVVTQSDTSVVFWHTGGLLDAVNEFSQEHTR